MKLVRITPTGCVLTESRHNKKVNKYNMCFNRAIKFDQSSSYIKLNNNKYTTINKYCMFYLYINLFSDLLIYLVTHLFSCIYVFHDNFKHHRHLEVS